MSHHHQLLFPETWINAIYANRSFLDSKNLLMHVFTFVCSSHSHLRLPPTTPSTIVELIKRMTNDRDDHHLLLLNCMKKRPLCHATHASIKYYDVLRQWWQMSSICTPTARRRLNPFLLFLAQIFVFTFGLKWWWPNTLKNVWKRFKRLLLGVIALNAKGQPPLWRMFSHTMNKSWLKRKTLMSLFSVGSTFIEKPFVYGESGSSSCLTYLSRHQPRESIYMFFRKHFKSVLALIVHSKDVVVYNYASL